jgi:hypothetical protein
MVDDSTLNEIEKSIQRMSERPKVTATEREFGVVGGRVDPPGWEEPTLQQRLEARERGEVEPGPLLGERLAAYEKAALAAHDAVNSPQHYNLHPSGVECITVVEHMTFNVGSAMKYLWRAGLKPGSDLVQDLEKAQWYLAREIGRLRNIGP